MTNVTQPLFRSASVFDMPWPSQHLALAVEAAEPLNPNCTDATLCNLIMSARQRGEFRVAHWLAGVHWYRDRVIPPRSTDLDLDILAGWAAAQANALLARVSS